MRLYNHIESLNFVKTLVDGYWGFKAKGAKCAKCYYIHWCSKLKEQPVLLLTSFVHNSSVNEHKSMKLRENICYEIIN